MSDEIYFIKRSVGKSFVADSENYDEFIEHVRNALKDNKTDPVEYTLHDEYGMTIGQPVLINSHGVCLDLQELCKSAMNDNREINSNNEKDVNE